MSGRHSLTIRALTLSTALVLLSSLLPGSVALAYASPQTFSLGPTGQALTSSSLAMAATLNNNGDKNACNVGISSILLLYPNSLALPPQTKLPLRLGEIDSDGSVTFQLAFNSS
jgi:hypothetical protein